jgi:hypothetical protein
LVIACRTKARSMAKSSFKLEHPLGTFNLIIVLSGCFFVGSLCYLLCWSVGFGD